jgi:hypothetical protein
LGLLSYIILYILRATFWDVCNLLITRLCSLILGKESEIHYELEEGLINN